MTIMLMQKADLDVPPHISALVRRTSRASELRHALDQIKDAVLAHLQEAGVVPVHSHALLVRT